MHSSCLQAERKVDEQCAGFLYICAGSRAFIAVSHLRTATGRYRGKHLSGSWLGDMCGVYMAAVFWYGESHARCLTDTDSVRASMRNKNEMLGIRCY